MLLTLKPSSQNGVKGPPQDYAIVRQSIPAAPRSSPPPAVSEPQTQSMESSRRGLPPPSGLTLPPPDVAFATVNPMNQHPLPPPPPPKRQDSDPSYYSWLEAKAEEDRRRQEEEKTRQETLRLEQRRIEQSMLRDSLHAGVPPHMIPLIFAGISQGGVPQSVLEVTQQFMTQSGVPPPPRGPPAPPSMPGLSHSSSQRRPHHVRRDSRSIPSSSHPYVTTTTTTQQQQQPVSGPGVLLSQPLPASAPSPTPQSLGRPSDPRAASSMPRFNQGESQGSQQQPAISLSNVHYAPGSSVPLSQSTAGKSDSQPRQSPPSLYFHHWVPPAQSQPNTPSGRPRQDSPGVSQHRRPDYQSSPGRKRKAPGPHQQAPQPSSRPPDNLPDSSQNSRSGSPMASTRPAEQSSHTRKRSDASNPYDARISENHAPESTGRGVGITRPVIRTVASTEVAGPERGHSRTEDRDHSGSPSRSESRANYSHPASQGHYASSASTAPPDSDPDRSPGHSPRKRVSRRLTRSDASPRG